jgi:hypothetical protein
MKVFNMILWRFVFIGISVTIILIGTTAYWWDLTLPSRPCQNFEGKQNGPFRFSRASWTFWSSTCRKQAKFYITSASEGDIGLSFPSVLKHYTGKDFDEFQSAHRGLKTTSFIFSHDWHSDRKANTHWLILINPVYFSFATKTDDASMYLTTLSSKLFQQVIGFNWRHKETWLETPFIVAKSSIQEFKRFIKHENKIEYAFRKEKKPDDYLYREGMRKKHLSPSSKGSWESEYPINPFPTKKMLDAIIDKTMVHKMPTCIVMLPLNLKWMRLGRNDIDEIQTRIKDFYLKLPEAIKIDLMDLGDQDYIFEDTMHLSEYGIHQVVKRITNSSCYQDQFKRGKKNDS